MKEQMKKIALLSLSLILTSAYSVSIVLPSLLQHFSEYTTAQVEMLISAPSFAITVMIVLNAWLSRYMKDRPMIVGGLLLLSVSGMVPVFVQEYPVMFASRIFLGIGIGLINAKQSAFSVNIMKAGKSGAARIPRIGGGAGKRGYDAGCWKIGVDPVESGILGVRARICDCTSVSCMGSGEYGDGTECGLTECRGRERKSGSGGRWKKRMLEKRSPAHCLCTVCGICHLHLLFQFPACPDADFGEETWNGVGSQHHSHAHDADGNSCRCLFWKTDDVVEGKIAGGWMPDAWSGDASDRICGQSAADWNWH